ncbi:MULTISPECIES: hypothetical protein [Terrabacteria group]|nr:MULTISPECIES: hypothetical protein [Terrabacteria group]
MRLEESQSEVIIMKRVVQIQFVFIEPSDRVVLVFGVENGVGFKVD